MLLCLQDHSSSNLSVVESQYNRSEGGTPFQRQLPNATAVLVLGIISIIGCVCYAVPGFICSIIALILASKDSGLYRSNPEAYTAGSYSNLKAGKICAIVGLSLSLLFALFIVGIVVIYGDKIMDPNFLKELQNMK